VKWGLIDRYLVLAEEQGIPAIVVLNKKDLLAKESESFQEKCAEEVATYKKLGYDVMELVAVDENDQQVSALQAILENKISIFTGHSGVGKSSLVNRFNPEIVQDVEPNSDIFYKGRHTTTYASFIKIASKGYAVDTPGIRSFTVGDRNAIDLTFGFKELRPFMGKCKFRECRHIDEPDCAVIEALNKGAISQRRYRSYCGLLLGETGREGRVRDDQVE
jgi:ribosome biogenesis GTPase